MIQTSIISKFQLEGLHKWEEAEKKMPEVNYLSNLHRHIFHIECEKLVSHSNRDKEFIMFSREIKKYLLDKYFDSTYNCCNFENSSCEDIGMELVVAFELLSCKVSEDDENAAICRIKTI